jgi:hypothetical protein
MSAATEIMAELALLEDAKLRAASIASAARTELSLGSIDAPGLLAPP